MTAQTSRSGRVADAPPDMTPQEVASTLVDGLFNAIFSLTFFAGLIRLLVVVTLFLISWTFFALTLHPIESWNQGTTVNLNFVEKIFLSAIQLDTLMHLIALLVPLFLAQLLAAIYLDDIYELKDVPIARRFISQAAFILPNFGILHLEQGNVRQSDKRSPIYNIGGPGRVRVSLDTVAVFEKIDGTPEVIGPTGGTPWYASHDVWFTRTIDGFERLRQVIDTRDQIIPVDLDARTRDGIVISLQNVRILFSIQRGDAASSMGKPFPYSEDAVLRLVYDQSKGPWETAIRSLVRGELLAFIADHTLAEIFASVGEPEINRQIERQNIIQKHIWQHRNRARHYRALNRLRSSTPVTPGGARFVRHYPRQMHPAIKKLSRPHPYKSPFRPRPERLRRRTVFPASAIGTRMNIPRRPVTWKPPIATPYKQVGAAEVTKRKFSRAAHYPMLYRPDLLWVQPEPPFVTRWEVSKRFFDQFVQNFPQRAHQRGVRLEWIDVGTWHIRSIAISNQHEEAWLMSVDNLKRSHRLVLDDLRRNGRANEIIRLLRRPIFRYLELSRQQVPPEEMVNLIIEEYLGMLRSVRDDLLRRGVPLPDSLVPAIEHIQRYQRDYMERKGGKFL